MTMLTSDPCEFFSAGATSALASLPALPVQRLAPDDHDDNHDDHDYEEDVNVMVIMIIIMTIKMIMMMMMMMMMGEERSPPCFLWHSEDSRCPLLAAKMHKCNHHHHCHHHHHHHHHSPYYNQHHHHHLPWGGTSVWGSAFSCTQCFHPFHGKGQSSLINDLFYRWRSTHIIICNHCDQCILCRCSRRRPSHPREPQLGARSPHSWSLASWFKQIIWVS